MRLLEEKKKKKKKKGGGRKKKKKKELDFICFTISPLATGIASSIFLFFLPPSPSRNPCRFILRAP